MKKLTASEILEANTKALIQGLPLPHTKQEHSNAQEFDAIEVRWWNRNLPTAEQYTKEEHSEAEGFDAYDARWWNRNLPHAEQYTQEEIEQLEK